VDILTELAKLSPVLAALPPIQIPEWIWNLDTTIQRNSKTSGGSSARASKSCRHDRFSRSRAGAEALRRYWAATGRAQLDGRNCSRGGDLENDLSWRLRGGQCELGPSIWFR